MTLSENSLAHSLSKTMNTVQIPHWIQHDTVQFPKITKVQELLELDDGWPESVEEQSLLLLLVWRHYITRQYIKDVLQADEKSSIKTILYGIVSFASYLSKSFSRTELFTDRRFCTQTLLHTDAFTHRRFYSHTLAQKQHCEFCCGMHHTCTKQSLTNCQEKIS